MRLSRLLLSAAVLLAFLAGFTSGQMYQYQYQPPDFLAEYIYHPMIVCIVRIYEFCKNVKGGWKGEIMGRYGKVVAGFCVSDCDFINLGEVRQLH